MLAFFKENIKLEDLQNIERLILDRNLAEAFVEMRRQAQLYGLDELVGEVDEHMRVYGFLLDFFVQGKPDPTREKNHRDISQRALKILDRLLKSSLDDKPPFIFHFAEYLSPNLTTYLQHELSQETIEQYFLRIWFTVHLSKSEEEGLMNLFSSAAPLHLRATLVSALNLSLWMFFDEAKFRILIDLVTKGEQQIWERALVGLVLALYLHDNRLDLYPELQAKIAALQEVPNIEQKVKAVVFQFIKSEETSSLTEKIETEILPELQRLAPEIEKKLDIDQILSENTFDEENPDWEKLFDTKDDVFDKMAELSMLQMDGSDILHSTFSKLKDFDFFEQVSNWFMPFYAQNREIHEYLQNLGLSESDIETLDQALEHSFYMCNSDKYSFCFQFSMIPPGQRSGLIRLFKAEASMSNEVKQDEALRDVLGMSRVTIVQYIQDLYRFFHVYRWANGMVNIFTLPLTFYSTKSLYLIVKSDQIDYPMAELYFSKKFYSKAIEVYKKISPKHNSAEIYEKIGFAYQKLKDFANALEYYKKAELFESEKKWLLKKIAYCSMKMGSYTDALEYYTRLYNNGLQDDLKLNLNIGNCYLRLEDYQNALKYYYKVEFYKPNDIKVVRPMVWSLFNLHRPEEALKLYSKLPEEEFNSYDFVTFGHLYFSFGDKTKAINKYLKAYEIQGDTFKEEFFLDKKILNSYGIENPEIKLMYDAVISKNF